MSDVRGRFGLVIGATVGIVIGVAPIGIYSYSQIKELSGVVKEDTEALLRCVQNTNNALLAAESAVTVAKKAITETDTCTEELSSQLRDLKIDTVRTPDKEVRSALDDCKSRLSIAEKLLQSREQQNKPKKDPPKKKKSQQPRASMKS